MRQSGEGNHRSYRQDDCRIQVAALEYLAFLPGLFPFFGGGRFRPFPAALIFCKKLEVKAIPGKPFIHVSYLIKAMIPSI